MEKPKKIDSKEFSTESPSITNSSPAETNKLTGPQLDFILTKAELYQARYIRAEQVILKFMHMPWYLRFFKGYDFFMDFLSEDVFNRPD